MPHYARRLSLYVLFATLLAVVGCDSDDSEEDPLGAVYTMTNAADGNEVVVFQRALDGSLTRIGAVATGGLGTGPLPFPPVNPLGAQDAMILSDDDRFLFVVNAESDEISSLRVEPDGMVSLIGTVPSGGAFPNSLTMHDDLLYVLNAAGPGNISGFRIADDGALSPLAGSTRPLSGTDTPLPDDGVAPGTIAFSPDGRHLAVTEKATNLIVVYQVGTNGLPGDPIVQQSVTPTPFGAEFDRNGIFIVSEANLIGPNTPAPDSSSVSSYSVAPDGTLSVVSAAVQTTETAACWIEITEDNRYVYTTNSLSGTITGFRIGSDGTLTPLDPDDGRTAVVGTMSFLLDMAITGEYLYVLAPGTGEVNGFRIADDGSLTPLPAATVGGLTGNTEGLAAF